MTLEASTLAVYVDRAIETEGPVEGFSARQGPGRAITLEYGWGRNEGGVRSLLIRSAEVPELPPEIPGRRVVAVAPGRWLLFPGPAWSIEIAEADLTSDRDWRPRLIIDPAERRAYVRHSFGSNSGTPCDEYHGLVTSVPLPTGYDGESVAEWVAHFDLDRFAAAFMGEERDNQGNLRGLWDVDARREAEQALYDHLERIPGQCRPALTVRQALDEALRFSAVEEIRDRLLEMPRWLAWHDEATIVDPEHAEEVGADWLRNNPEEEE